MFDDYAGTEWVGHWERQEYRCGVEEGKLRSCDCFRHEVSTWWVLIGTACRATQRLVCMA